ncbi:GTP cyclohydrolase [Actibacterium atlanticum]|uniref:GTP cyclohydrolase n=2 Tax=Actibacterium atlanticum TaxID=1461693 RepID=A0A058ZPY0_9RHOB|nr:GTP cyclohydrolase FolE2 [Actibacterium atlanticum]KCV83270.1 GTP cyclohydrolase [Actibacterium atlanticum]
MNIHNSTPDLTKAEKALSRQYPEDFTADSAYRETLPDLQNGPASLIRGEDRMIQHVGISNFRLPLQVGLRDGSVRELDCSVTGTVSLEAGKKGINMSRIMRSFYDHAESQIGFGVVEAALDSYHRDLEAFDARIALKFSLPLKVPSLRSGLEGFQYYDAAMEVVDQNGTRRRILHLDYVYSSTCPCSMELAEHARQTRGQMATPHAQRSVARISVLCAEDLHVEDLIDHCRAAVPTETQVMVKREDEQAFAELNAANPIFVEDAVRLFAERLSDDPRVGDFRVVASHQESLHSHDAVSVVTQGSTFAARSMGPEMFGSLVHPG